MWWSEDQNADVSETKSVGGGIFENQKIYLGGAKRNKRKEEGRISESLPRNIMGRSPLCSRHVFFLLLFPRAFKEKQKDMQMEDAEARR